MWPPLTLPGTSVLTGQEGGDPRALSAARWNPRELARKLVVVEVIHALIKLSLVSTCCMRPSEVDGKPLAVFLAKGGGTQAGL